MQEELSRPQAGCQEEPQKEETLMEEVSGLEGDITSKEKNAEEEKKEERKEERKEEESKEQVKESEESRREARQLDQSNGVQMRRKEETMSVGERVSPFAVAREIHPQRIIPQLECVKFTIFGGNAQGLLRSVLKEFRPNWIEIAQDQGFEYSNFVWKPTHFTPVMYDAMGRKDDSVQIRIINHMENIRGITTKTGLVRSLKLYYKRTVAAMDARYGVWETIPTSFIITPRADDFEYTQFCQRFKELARGNFKKEHTPVKHCSRNMWLVKPAAMNQGKGIELFKNLNDIQSYISTKPGNSNFVVQKYLEKPLLYHNYKFDIRVWAIMTWKNEVLFYNRGYLRLASAEYSNDDQDLSVHLTNQMLQKKLDSYGKVFEGNAISFEDFQDYINEQYPGHDLKMQEDMVSRMKDIVVDTFQSVKKQINPNKRRDVFELFGYDFMVDEDLRVWLIEINTNPSLSVPTNDYCAELFPKMITEMYSLIVAPTVEPNHVPQIEETEWDLLYCEANSKFSPVPVNKRRPFDSKIYPIEELEQKIRYPPRQKSSARTHLKNQSLNFSNISNLDMSSTVPTVNNTVIHSPRQQLPPIDIHTTSIQNKKQQGKEGRNLFQNSRSSFSKQSKRSKYTLFHGGAGAHRMHINQSIDNAAIVQSEDEERGAIKEEEELKEGSSHFPTPLKSSKQANLSFVIKRDIYDEVKEYMQAKNFRKEGVLGLFRKLWTKFAHWELTTEKNRENLQRAMLCLYNPGFFQYLTGGQEIEKLVDLFLLKEMPLELQSSVVNVMLRIAKVLSYRTALIRAQNFGSFLSRVIEMSELQQKEEGKQEEEMKENCVRMLCELCSASDRKIYIPGETSEVLRIQREAIESGVYLTVLHIFTAEHTSQCCKELIQTQVINYLGLNDLSHHQEFMKTFSSSTTNLLRNEQEIKELVEKEQVKREYDGGETPPPRAATKLVQLSEKKPGALTHRPHSIKAEPERKNSASRKYRVHPPSKLVSGDFHRLKEVIHQKAPSRLQSKGLGGVGGGGGGFSMFTEGPMTKDALGESHLEKELLVKIKVSSIKRFLSERAAELHEEQQIRQEQENKRRMEKIVQDTRIREQKEKEHEERKKKAEEIFKRRVEENRKKQEEAVKRIKQEQEIRQQQEEERRVKMMELIKKRDQDRKQQRIEEEKKKKENEQRRHEEFQEARKLKIEEQKKAYEDWSKQKQKEVKLRKQKPTILRRKAELEERLDNILISEGYDVGKLGSPPRHKGRKSSLPVSSEGQQNLIEVVSYTPKDGQHKLEDRLNLTTEQGKHKRIQSMSGSKQDSLEKISNNLYFEFHSSDAGTATPDLQNVVFAGKPKNTGGMVLIKEKLNRQDSPGRRSVERGAQSVSPEVASLLLASGNAAAGQSPLKENVPKRILGNTASKQSLSMKAKKSFQSEALSKNVRRKSEVGAKSASRIPRTGWTQEKVALLQSKKGRGCLISQLSMKDALAKDSLIAGQLLYQSPDPLNNSQLESQVVESQEEESEEERSAPQAEFQ